MRKRQLICLLLGIMLSGCADSPSTPVPDRSQTEPVEQAPVEPTSPETHADLPSPASSQIAPVTDRSSDATTWQLIDGMSWPKPQARFNNFDSAKARFWSVYENGGTELYCRVKFNTAAARSPNQQDKPLNIEHAYPADRIALFFGHPDRDCGASASSFVDKKCARAVADMHNLWPAYQSINSSRKDLRFADLPGETNRTQLKVNCADFERTYKRSIEDFVDPTPDARGDIARSLIYMSKVYGMPLDGATSDASLLIEWHLADPPDNAEQDREREIRRLQGTWNPLIIPSH
ncbi:MAG: hypothetical protein EOO15_12265 [Chitinophagaceae bacterium]|nr:MAG: hypothetical protein EOO15_12265 [Chitinophagaceae bacterium]